MPQVRATVSVFLKFGGSCLENLPFPDREAWQAIVYRVAESDMTEVTRHHKHKTFIFGLWQFCPNES